MAPRGITIHSVVNIISGIYDQGPARTSTTETRLVGVATRWCWLFGSKSERLKGLTRRRIMVPLPLITLNSDSRCAVAGSLERGVHPCRHFWARRAERSKSCRRDHWLDWTTRELELGLYERVNDVFLNKVIRL